MNQIDAETRVIMNGLPFLHPSDQREASRYAMERTTMFAAGVSRVPYGVNERLKRDTGDANLQIRWDFELGTWILERWQKDEQYWLCVMTLANKFNQTPALNENYLRNLVNLLKAGDLQRIGPEEHIKAKRAISNAKKAENRTKGDNMLMAAIDAMSSKQIKNFIDVHRAIHTGETIAAHGDDLKSLDRMAEISSTAPPVPSGKGLNPGMHPMIYERKPR